MGVDVDEKANGRMGMGTQVVAEGDGAITLLVEGGVDEATGLRVAHAVVGAASRDTEGAVAVAEASKDRESVLAFPVPRSVSHLRAI